MMPTFVEYPAGAVYGRLTVTRTRERGEKSVECVCECGAVRLVAAQNLASGQTKSCGCLQGDLARTPYLAGFRWGALTVVRDRGPREKYLECVCDCGKPHAVMVKHVGLTMSCGCVNRRRRSFPNIIIGGDETSISFFVGVLPATVDRADLAVASSRHWSLLRGRDTRFYAFAKDSSASKTIYLHRLIAETGEGVETDHVNGNGLDNRRSNLRVASCSQNSANTWKPRRRDGQPTSSRFKGVSYSKSGSCWVASLTSNGKTHRLGRFSNEVEAAKAYDAAALHEWGEFAFVNFRNEEAA